MANIAFDIDNTLYKVEKENVIGSGGMGRERQYQVLDFELINLMLWYLRNGDTVWIWSAGGKEYAQSFKDKFFRNLNIGILEKKLYLYFDVTEKYGIDICYDDQEVKLAKVNILVRRVGE
jgi:FMN phosphatase YigB (HAD superfamily)